MKLDDSGAAASPREVDLADFDARLAAAERHAARITANARFEKPLPDWEHDPLYGLATTLIPAAKALRALYDSAVRRPVPYEGLDSPARASEPHPPSPVQPIEQGALVQRVLDDVAAAEKAMNLAYNQFRSHRDIRALCELLQSVTSSEQWVLVPREPTEEMVKAAYWYRGQTSFERAGLHAGRFDDAELNEYWPDDKERVIAEQRGEWAAMLKAAPSGLGVSRQ